MKEFIFIVLILLAQKVHAQTDMREGRHIFNYDTELSQCSFDGTPLRGTPTEKIKENTIFTIRRVVGTDYIIQIAKYTSNTATAQALNLKFYKTTADEDIFFKLPKAVYELNAQKLERKGNFTVGAATTLIKVRPGRKEPVDNYAIYSEFGNDFNIGISAGWKIKPNRKLEVTHSIVGGLSFSSIKATPYTTKGFLKSESTQACITLSAGYVFEYNKFQISLFSGIDVMSGQVGREWIYRNRPWLGLGFGYQIFRGEGEKGNEP